MGCEDLAPEMLPVLKRVEAGEINALVIDGSAIQTSAEQNCLEGDETAEKEELELERCAPDEIEAWSQLRQRKAAVEGMFP